MFTNNVGYSGGTDPSSNDEEGPFNVTGADSDESEEKGSNFLISTLKCFITLIPKLAALAFSLVLAEVILLMFVADYGFVDYFLRWVISIHNEYGSRHSPIFLICDQYLLSHLSYSNDHWRNPNQFNNGRIFQRKAAIEMGCTRLLFYVSSA